jgi:hypothetical protein
MRRGFRSWALALLIAAAFFWGAVALFNRQFASGEIYPQFSTLRTDRLGAKLLYDSLAALPGVSVSRNYLPMEFLPRDGATLVLLGVDPMRVNWNGDLLLRSVERIAGRGNRVVLAMYVDPEDSPFSQADLDRPDQSKKPPAKGKSKTDQPQEPPLRTLWKVSLQLDPDEKQPHPLYFGQADGWSIREKAGDKILAIEREFGKGSVVLMAESADFTNGAAVTLSRLPQVSWCLGPYRRIVFDEQHLGIAESGSVVGMARQFRLMGLAFGLALCTALFIWKNTAGFPPPAVSRSVERLSGRTSQAGLLTLLKRHIPPAELAGACWREWLSTNRNRVTPEIRQQAEAIADRAAPHAVEAAREIQTLLHTKGEL